MSKADCIAAKAPSYIGMPYKLGEEGRYVAGPEQTKAEDIDCSGLVWSLWLDCGVKLNGKKPDRLTADAYWRVATPIDRPEIPGDCCWFPKTGRKTHIAIYIGNGRTIEAGYHGSNNRYPGHGYVGTCTIAQMNARGAVWGRIKGLDIYDETEEDMNKAETRAIVRDELRKSTIIAYPPDEKEATEALDRLGVLAKTHKSGLLVNAGLLRVLLYRAMKLAGK